jgi:hypothetical protein
MRGVQREVLQREEAQPNAGTSTERKAATAEHPIGSEWLIQTTSGNLRLRVRAREDAAGTGNLQSGTVVTVIAASDPATERDARAKGFVAVRGEVEGGRVAAGFVHVRYLVPEVPHVTDPPATPANVQPTQPIVAALASGSAQPAPDDVLFHIVRLQKPGDVGTWWSQGPKQNKNEWSGPLRQWEQYYIATFTGGGVPPVLRMRPPVDPNKPTSEERAEALRLFGNAAAGPSAEAESLRRYANYENRRRIVAHYTLTHPATVRLQLGLYRFVRDANPLHFAFERGFQVGGGKEMFTENDASRVGAAAEFFLALGIAFGTAKLLQAIKPPTGPTTPMPEVNVGASKKLPAPNASPAASAGRPFVAQCTDASCGGASGQMAAHHLGVMVTQEQIIKAKGFSPTTTQGHTKIPGGFSSPRALAEALELHAKVPGRTWQAKNVFPKAAGVSRMPNATDLEVGIRQGLADGGGVFIAKTRLGRHFIVIDELRGKIVIGRDPATGRFERTLQEFLDMQWDGDIVLAQ